MLEIDCHVEWVDYVDPNGVQKVNLIGKKGGNHDPGDHGIALLGHIDTVPAIGWESMHSRLGSRDQDVWTRKLRHEGQCRLYDRNRPPDMLTPTWTIRST